MASLSYYSASKLEPNIQEFHSEMTMQQLPPELLFDFDNDVEQNFYDNPDQTCYYDTFFDPDELILPAHDSCFMPEYSDFQSTPKQQKVFQDNCLPDIMTPSHNSCFMPECSVSESNPKRQKVFQDNCLPNIVTPSHGLFNGGFVSNPPIFQDFSSYSIPEIPMPVFSSGCCSNNAGGHRMNTAEMLQATFKYIKFLQAQAGLLEFMGSISGFD